MLPINKKTLILIIFTAIITLAGFGFTREIWAVCSWTAGKVGSALQLNGSTDYVDVGNVYNGVKSIEFWVKPDDITSHTDYIVDLNGTDYIKIVDGEVTVNNISDPTYYVDGISGEQTIPDTTNWHHVVITTETGINASDLDIGKLEGTGLFGGGIDEVKFYGRVLSVTEVRYHYNKGGPIAYWKFEEGEGTTAYDSGEPGGNNGSLENGPQWVSGKYGTALKFDGDNDYVEATVSQDKTTVSLWAQNDSTWEHVVNLAGTYYVNGEPGTPTSYPIYISGDTVQIGKTGASTYFKGVIDDVRIYNYSRTGEQILTDYNQGMAVRFGPLSSCDHDPGSCMDYGLVGYWLLNEGTGQTAYDSSGQDHHGTVTPTSCSGDGECDSGHCVDGYCCNTACSEVCEGCDVAGAIGTCTARAIDSQPTGCTGCNYCNGSGVCWACTWVRKSWTGSTFANGAYQECKASMNNQFRYTDNGGPETLGCTTNLREYGTGGGSYLNQRQYECVCSQ